MSALGKSGSALWRTVWRWHFYAGLFVMPMVLVLATTGMTYLFKPQVERWEERAFQGLPSAGAVTPDAQVAAALAATPGARLHYYRLPEFAGDAALVHVALPHVDQAGPDKPMRDIFVSPQGQVLGSLDPKARIMEVVQRVHGQLLIGRQGSWIVELAASWAIVMLITGVILWWPKNRLAGRGLAGVLWPRADKGGRTLLRDLHAVTGFWVAGLAMVLLLTGLPWADVWGSAFKAVRAELGWVKGKQDWTIGGRAPDAGSEHADHDHAAMLATSMAGMSSHDHGMMHVPLGAIVARAKGEHLPFPVLVSPPDAKTMVWTVKSDTQNRPQRVSITYDAMTGKETARETFADKHPIDRVIGYGVAWHEGALFGWVNQLIGVLTALALITLSVTGFLMWRRRKPSGALGAPPFLEGRRIGKGAKVIGLVLLLLLPLFALSVLALWLFDRLILPRTPWLAGWLGLRP